MAEETKSIVLHMASAFHAGLKRLLGYDVKEHVDREIDQLQSMISRASVHEAGELNDIYAKWLAMAKHNRFDRRQWHRIQSLRTELTVKMEQADQFTQARYVKMQNHVKQNEQMTALWGLRGNYIKTVKPDMSPLAQGGGMRTVKPDMSPLAKGGGGCPTSFAPPGPAPHPAVASMAGGPTILYALDMNTGMLVPMIPATMSGAPHG